jgi:hypothetical protein
MATKKKKKSVSNKTHTFIVMYAPGEMVSGKLVGPYGKFKSIMTDDLQLKVDKGFLTLEK